MTLFQDLRLALRHLYQRPAFTLVALAMLALGIGAVTAIFSVVHGVLLAPLPFPEGDRLVFFSRPDASPLEADVSLPDVEDWRATNESFTELGVFIPQWDFDLVGDGTPRRLQGAVVEAQFFGVLGARPILGRFLEPADNRLGGDRVAVISHRLWQELFAGRDDALGEEVVLSGNPTTIVGVAPPELDVFELDLDLWVPVAVETPWAVGERGTNNFEMIGRLGPGVELADAKAEMLRLSEQLREAYPTTNKGKIIEPVPLREALTGDVEAALLVLLAAVALVLLVTSLNLASLLLARTLARSRDLATQRALGASRGRLVQQIVAEGTTLALVGGGLGMLLAVWMQDLLLAFAPSTLPRAANVGVDGWVFGCGLLAALAAGLVMSLLPAWRIVRDDPAGWLAGRSGDTSREGQRWLAGVVGAEVALAVLLLVGGGLLLRSLDQLSQVELGFETEGVLLAEVILPESRYGEREAQSAAFKGIVEAISLLPGVEAAASVIGAPLEPRGGIGHRLIVESQPRPEPGEEAGARHRPVHGDYFSAIGQPILAGRAFTSDDDEGAPLVAIVNQRFAQRHFGDQSPLGERISWLMGSSEPRFMTIVGVTADIKGTTLDREDTVAVYTPYLQRDAQWKRWGTLLVRTASDPAARVREVEQAVWSVDPTLPLTGIETLAERRAGALGRERFQVVLLGAFAATALSLAVLGIYGVLSFVLGRRRREIGIRLALGARAGDVERREVLRGMRPAVAGLAVGILAALALSRLIAGLLFGVAPTDAWTYLMAALVVVSAAFLGCWLPARRAGRIEPMLVLREE